MAVDPNDITPGALLLVRDAYGNDIRVRALSRPMQGKTFPIVRICAEAKWPPGVDDEVPWPLEDVLEVLSDDGG